MPERGPRGSPSYRYEVTAIRGEPVQNLRVGEHLVEFMDRGETTTWTIVDLQTGKTRTTIEGRFVGLFVAVREGSS